MIVEGEKLNEEKKGKGKEDEKHKGKVELKGRNKCNGGWARGGRDGGKQKKGEMKSEEKQKIKKGQKGIVSRELATTGIVYTVTEGETNA